MRRYLGHIHGIFFCYHLQIEKKSFKINNDVVSGKEKDYFLSSMNNDFICHFCTINIKGEGVTLNRIIPNLLDKSLRQGRNASQVASNFST